MSSIRIPDLETLLAPTLPEELEAKPPPVSKDLSRYVRRNLFAKYKDRAIEIVETRKKARLEELGDKILTENLEKLKNDQPAILGHKQPALLYEQKPEEKDLEERLQVMHEFERNEAEAREEIEDTVSRWALHYTRLSEEITRRQESVGFASSRSRSRLEQTRPSTAPAGFRLSETVEEIVEEKPQQIRPVGPIWLSPYTNIPHNNIVHNVPTSSVPVKAKPVDPNQKKKLKPVDKKKKRVRKSKTLELKGLSHLFSNNLEDENRPKPKQREPHKDILGLVKERAIELQGQTKGKSSKNVAKNKKETGKKTKKRPQTADPVKSAEYEEYVRKLNEVIPKYQPRFQLPVPSSIANLSLSTEVMRTKAALKRNGVSVEENALETILLYPEDRHYKDLVYNLPSASACLPRRPVTEVKKKKKVKTKKTKKKPK
eukprot:TRINITY_DN2677_c0_g1_i1.p1 TRINITY_DN2677_c0_g1~~TRINITY_DN2677_c0_g1_i1.p1  ORF type:complete len:430 (+),score=119.10 TRINITY_DN2677_c0_g1_i1:177-1466(+)